MFKNNPAKRVTNNHENYQTSTCGGLDWIINSHDGIFLWRFPGIPGPRCFENLKEIHQLMLAGEGVIQAPRHSPLETPSVNRGRSGFELHQIWLHSWWTRMKSKWHHHAAVQIAWWKLPFIGVSQNNTSLGDEKHHISWDRNCIKINILSAWRPWTNVAEFQHIEQQPPG